MLMLLRVTNTDDNVIIHKKVERIQIFECRIIQSA